MQKLSKPFPHRHKGRAGLAFVLAAYRSGRVRGAVLIGGIAVISVVAFMFHATTGALIAAVLLPVSGLAVFWNVRYANRLRRLCREPTTGRAKVTHLFGVTYHPMGNFRGPPLLDPETEPIGSRDPALKATCIFLDDQPFLISGAFDQVKVGDEVAYEAVPQIMLLLRIDQRDVDEAMWCHLWHTKAVTQNAQRLARHAP